MKLLFNNTACKILYNSDLHVIQTQWRNVPVNSKTYRTVLNWLITGINVYDCPIIIADVRQINMIWKEDRKWTIEDWYPRAIKAGFRKRAFIVSENSFGCLAIKKIVESFNTDSVETRFFKNFHEATLYVSSTSDIKVTTPS